MIADIASLISHHRIESLDGHQRTLSDVYLRPQRAAIAADVRATLERAGSALGPEDVDSPRGVPR